MFAVNDDGRFKKGDDHVDNDNDNDYHCDNDDDDDEDDDDDSGWLVGVLPGDTQ